MLLIKHLLTRFFVLISSWHGYDILKGDFKFSKSEVDDTKSL